MTELLAPIKTQYPWFVSTWQKVSQHLNFRPNMTGLLMTGKPGLGHFEFGLFLAKQLLCHKPDPQHMSCGQCHACHLMSIQQHPDCLVIAPMEGQSHIKLDQIRPVTTALHQAAQLGHRKIILIDQAEGLNTSCANALLKVLEEPPEHCIFIFLSAYSKRLISTIRSRLMRFELSLSYTDGMDWLQRQPALKHLDAKELWHDCSGGVLQALSWVESGQIQQQQQLTDALINQQLSSFVKHAKSMAYPDVIRLMWRLTQTMLQRTLGAKGHPSALKIPLISGVTQQQLLVMMSQLKQLQNAIDQQVTLNIDLCLEQLYYGFNNPPPKEQ